MRAYLWISGLIFAGIVVAHIVRIVVEPSEVATDPHFVLLTLASAILAGWAVRLLWGSRGAA